jgi:hypothetical protein
MTPSDTNITIGATLDKVATKVTALGGGVWTFALLNGRPFGARAVVRDGWLTVGAPLGTIGGAGASRREAWDVLAQNALLGGGVRQILTGGVELGVCADLALDADLDLATRIHDACRGIEAAKGGLSAGAPLPAAAPDAPAPSELAAICRQTGWTIRDGERLAVDLDVPAGILTAEIAAARGAVTVAVPLFDEAVDDATPVCRQALATLLLRTSAVVRMVRATTIPGAPPCFAVSCPGRPSAAELAHALGALSVACGVAAREAHLLRHDDTLARRYVEQQRRSTADEKED